MMRRFLLTALIALTFCLSGPAAKAEQVSRQAVIETYADIALATYSDSLDAAYLLAQSISDLINSPSEESLYAAREAWVRAREPYQQTEAFRFGNPLVDYYDRRLNAWPVDESFIDYVQTNGFLAASEPINLIAQSTLIYNGARLDVSELSPQLLSEALHELGGNEAHIAIGFHAIEFLLWGQDLNLQPLDAGQRPASDFDPQACTNGHCARRVSYLAAVTEQLIEDLTEARKIWSEQGAARLNLTKRPYDEALAMMFSGLGSLAYGELAGERMKLGLLLQDQEEEHDCFSDNTHNSHLYNVIGLRNIYFGTYQGTRQVSGPGLDDLIRQTDPALAQTLEQEFEQTLTAFRALHQRAETTERYDQMISHASSEGVEHVEAGITALIRLAKGFERSSAALNLDLIRFEGSDSLDSPTAVFE